MYVKEYLQFVANIHKIPVSRVDEVIDLVGITPEKSKKIGQLSKGYKQRVGLAQAIIHQPDLLILDEPTNGLDPNQIIEIRNVVKEIGQQKTVLLSTHIMQEVEALVPVSSLSIKETYFRIVRLKSLKVNLKAWKKLLQAIQHKIKNARKFRAFFIPSLYIKWML
jgi:ABC-type multidrug transport system ATPase subunit